MMHAKRIVLKLIKKYFVRQFNSLSFQTGSLSIIITRTWILFSYNKVKKVP